MTPDLTAPDGKKYDPCGGCGADHPSKACIGCRHPFALLNSHGEERKGPLRAFIKSECVEGETYVRESDHATRLSASHAVISELRAIFPAVCEALGNGAYCTGDNSIEFLREIPKEVALVIKGKDALIGDLEGLLARARDFIEPLTDREYDLPNDFHVVGYLDAQQLNVEIGAALRRADGKEGES